MVTISDRAASFNHQPIDRSFTHMKPEPPVMRMFLGSYEADPLELSSVVVAVAPVEVVVAVASLLLMLLWREPSGLALTLALAEPNDDDMAAAA